MSRPHHIERTCSDRSVRHGIAITIPEFVKREVSALKSEGCSEIIIAQFDRASHVWSVTFEQGSKRLARLLWCMEVDA